MAERLQSATLRAYGLRTPRTVCAALQSDMIRTSVQDWSLRLVLISRVTACGDSGRNQTITGATFHTAFESGPRWEFPQRQRLQSFLCLHLAETDLVEQFNVVLPQGL